MGRLSVAFFLSGFGALLCQIVWQRMLGIFAGSDSVSAALVVGAFLAGLGLGSILGAKLADRLSPRRALLGFALAEIGVGAFALLSKAFLYDWLATGLAGVVDSPAAIFALCFGGLVLPTALMGASLPLPARWPPPSTRWPSGWGGSTASTPLARGSGRWRAAGCWRGTSASSGRSGSPPP